MLKIVKNDYRDTLGISDITAFAHLKNIPSSKRGSSKEYVLADVIPAMQGRYAGAMPGLLAKARPDNAFGTFVGGDEAVEPAERLEAWLTLHVDGARTRIHQVRRSFAEGLGRAVRSSALMSDAERLRLLILRSDIALPFLITGDRSGLPRDWAEPARIFALLHSAPPRTFEIVTSDE